MNFKDAENALRSPNNDLPPEADAFQELFQPFKPLKATFQ
jgi:hypothetical protein